jgi:hypothetical protein
MDQGGRRGKRGQVAAKGASQRSVLIWFVILAKTFERTEIK